MKKDKFLFWIDNFQTLTGVCDGEEDYWLGSYNEQNQQRLTLLLSSILNVNELKAGDIIVLNFDTRKLGYARDLQEDTSSYSLKLAHIRYNLELDEKGDGNNIVCEKWYCLKPLLDKTLK